VKGSRAEKQDLKIAATIEARMGSSRLPGKVLLPANGRPILAHMLERLRRVPSIGTIVVATTGNERDDDLEAFAASEGVQCFRGSEDDVMARVVGAGESVGADVLVGFTGDCPLVDPQIVEQTIQMFLHNTCEYVSTGYIPSYPAGVGDNHVFFLDTLRRSRDMSDDPDDRENVGMHIHNHPELFSQIYLVGPADLSWPELQLLLDTKADYELLKRVIEHFGDTNPTFGCAEILALFRANPDWLEINKTVVRNEVADGRPDRAAINAERPN